MIILKKLSWSNAFSYGPDNSIDLDKYDLIQLIGKNGHGKSSIALILEEVLYNKNSKGIKKADILNRYSKNKSYSISLTLTKDNSEYLIETVRGSTQTVKLIKDGEDISAHTSTATYKMIEDIIGFDHKTFTQIVYQSSSASLEFLTATDTNRKKFLIELLNLSIYTRAADLFKKVLKDWNEEAEVLAIKIKTINDWLIKFGKEDFTEKPILEVPEQPLAEQNELAEINHQLKNIENSNKKITQNNTYKKILSEIDITPVAQPYKDIKPLQADSDEILREITKLDAIIKGTGPIRDTCGACGQPIDNSHKKVMVLEATAKKAELVLKLGDINKELEDLGRKYSKHEAWIKRQAEWEKYYTLVDKTLPSEVYDRSALEKRVTELNILIRKATNIINSVVQQNSVNAAHNAKIAVVLGQMDTMRADLLTLTKRNSEVLSKVNDLQILVKTFSTTGLVAYKIECLVKDLEEITNDYLLSMSDGRFQLSFKINASDKLNVVITDNGRDIDILALSNGERARVNISTLLAIRKIMQSLSNSRINLLILDETVESLDAEGKERLIETLLEEEHLNTVLVSHGFSHPLLEKINIVKENNISRIE
jgi:DNA repair exonuclease SbcCD ATPase subunit